MKRAVPIQLIYPSYEFQQQQSKAVETQANLREEAEEHYQMLKALSLEDPEYQRQLRVNHERKSQIKLVLENDKHWKRFAKSK
jgi:hypothetical protein